MLPSISYGMKNRADQRPYLREFSERGPRKIPLYGVVLWQLAKILDAPLSDQYIFDLSN